ncbi:hypothetical protein SDC9_46022 [bioreactor metagenome]|uniref:Lipocalin-like domain-containing protein n=1 Tax=bioreactor metagenome TaxID=1076179 RepID=A0A644W7U7_9ZZZZ
MKHNYSQKLLVAACIVTTLNFVSCGKYEEGPEFSIIPKKARLTGEWEVVKVGDYNTDPSVSVILDFEKDGDFDYTYEYGSGYNYGYSGEWEWEDHKEIIEVELDGYVMDWEVLRLTNDELWFEYDNEVWECEKK